MKICRSSLILIMFFIISKLLGQIDEVYTGRPPDSTLTKNNTKNRRINERWSERLVYSGNISINYWNGWYVFLNPRIGIKTDKKNIFIAGAGPVFLYWGQRNFGNFYLYGPMIYGMINVSPNFYLAAEYYYINQQDFMSSLNPFQRIWVPYTYVGGGYRSRITDGLGTNISVLFNITPHRSSVFSNPFIQVGFIVGI
ncbi:MAG: hypothetical protein N3F09_08070 [Bacteroidia bacterium]|nr:hypothetical protein [Bacteroidia bacterium]